MSPHEQSEMIRDRRDLARGALQILSGSGVRMVARVMLIVFVAKMYGVNVFGRLGETVAIIELAAAFAAFGLNKTLLGELAKAGNSSATLRHTLYTALTLSAVISISIGTALWLIWGNIFPSHAAPRYAAFGVPLIAMSDVALTATRHFRTVAWDTIAKAIIKPWGFLLLALAGYFVSTSPTFDGIITISLIDALILGYVLSLLLAALLAFVVVVKMYGLPRKAISIRNTLQLGRRTFPIAINETGIFALRRIDIIILGIVAGPAASGVYYLGRQLATVVEKMRYMFEPMLAPIIAQSQSDEKIGVHLSRLCLFVFTVQLGMLSFVFLFGDQIMSWFGQGFAVGASVLVLLLLAELIDGTVALTELPIVFRHPRWPPRSILVTVIIETALVALFGHYFGAMGAAIGFLFAMLVLASIRLILVYRFFGYWIFNPTYLEIAGIAGALTGAGFLALLLSDHQIAAQIACAIAFVGGYAVLSRKTLRSRKLPT
ncbi:lipopolysaccharide biosynthesis protein [Hyphococcus sp. DH-69]|uniref:lipopolysaccharide biosynthesis protein n=1 Tax=Hyphococcus formosus TaxID=3143534 RepID=UPI00398ABAD8